MRWCWLLVVAACGDNARARVDAGAIDADADAPDAPDAPPDAPPDAEVFGPWSAPSMTPLPADSDDPTMTADGRELYFNVSGDIYVVTRATAGDPWSSPSKVTELSGSAFETTPEVLPDGLTIYFSSTRTPTLGQTDIWRSTRADRQSAWGTPVHMTELSTSGPETAPTTLDDLTMVLCASSNGAPAVFAATRSSTSDPWPAPVEITELTSGVSDCDPMLSSDRLTIYYGTLSSGGGDIFVATRESESAAFGNLHAIDNIDTPLDLEGDPWISLDGHHMFLESNQGGTYGIFESSR